MVSIKQRAALISIAITVALTSAKAAVGLWSGSLAILTEAAHGLVDVGATLLTFYAVSISDKPADTTHHYGHGKSESLAALAETAFLFLVSGIVMTEAVRRLWEDSHPVTVTPIMAVFVLIVIAVDAWRVREMGRIAHETGSHALESGALHFASDMAASAVVLVGLIFVWLGYPKADAIAAIAVAILICVMSWRLGQRTIDTLMDAAPKGVSEAIAKAVRRVPGVVDLDQMRLRTVGPTVFAEIMVKVSRTLPLDRVVAIKQAVSDAAAAVHPGTSSVVTANPIALDDETVLERVHVIARNEGLAVHHVTVHHLGDVVSIGLDLEVDGALTLAEAHEVASALETAIRAELGMAIEVETHIEPLQVETISGLDCPPETVAAVTEALQRFAGTTGPVEDVHNIRVRSSDEGLIVNFHCRTDPALKVREVHSAVDEVERQLRLAFPAIARVVSHAEPRRPTGALAKDAVSVQNA